MSSIFSLFYNRLKDKKGEPVRKLLEDFVIKYNLHKSSGDTNDLKKLPRETQSDLVEELMDVMTDCFNSVFPPTSPQEAEINGEGVENVITKNLFAYLFATNQEELD
jgi:hypothetical protein